MCDVQAERKISIPIQNLKERFLLSNSICARTGPSLTD